MSEEGGGQEGPAEGCTLLLLERADPAAAAAFWGA